MDVVQERDQNNNVTASYTRTGNIGGILARTTATGSVFYGYDGGGNVVTLTNNTGAEVGSYTYDAWGNTVATSGSSASENPYRFSTKEQIGGLYSYGFRFYSPGMGRWINRDPIGENGGTNLYGFVGNDPVNMSDMYGLAPAPGEKGYGPNASGGWPYRGPGMLEGSVRAGAFLGTWSLGLGKSNRYYGPNSVETQEIRKSLGAAYIRSQIASVGYRTVPNPAIRSWNGISSAQAYKFTIRQPLNGTQAQIGGFEWRAIREGNKMHIIARNDADFNSFFYHAPDAVGIPSYNRAGNGFGPMGRINQTFEWWEDVPSCRRR